MPIMYVKSIENLFRTMVLQNIEFFIRRIVINYSVYVIDLDYNYY